MADPIDPIAGEGASRRQNEAATVFRILAWLVSWVLMLSLWLLVTDTLSLAEVLVGAGAAALAATLAEGVRYQSGARLGLEWRWLLAGLALPAAVARDTLVVVGALCAVLARRRPPASRFREVTEDGIDLAAVGAAQRAWLMAARSVAPNSIVLGIDTDRGVMLVHELVAPDDGQRR